MISIVYNIVYSTQSSSRGRGSSAPTSVLFSDPSYDRTVSVPGKSPAFHTHGHI